MAWQLEQGLRCGGCGHPTDETMDPDNEGAYTAQPLKCHACAARSAAAENFNDGRTKPGIYWIVERG